MSRIAAFIDHEQPDIVVLQEVRFDAQVSPDNQATQLNKHLDAPLIYENICISRFYRPSVGEAYREGLAVLSKWPIVKSEVLALTKRPDDKHTRVVQNMDLQLEGAPFALTNVHFSNNRYSGEQLQETLDIIHRRGENRVIVGDLNIFDISGYAYLYASEYKSSADFIDYVSFPSEGVTLDYVLLPRKYQFKNFAVIPGLSDHNALVSVIEVTT